MEDKVLFIDSWDNVGDFFRNERNKLKNVENVKLYKNNSIINKFLRFCGTKLFKPILYLTYGNWKRKIGMYDMYILESRNTFEYAVKYIRKKTNKRIIVWYWNEVTAREMDPQYIKTTYNCEAWTFDKNDARKYNMEFNDTYFFNINREKKTNKLKQDVFYVGIDREGRISELQKLKKIFDQQQISYKLKLTTSPIKKKEKNYKYSERLDYYDVIKNVLESKVILDLTKKTQYGLTLRPMEALFLKKKLITNNINIKNYKFYNKNNIFIIGQDDYKNLNTFVNSEFVTIDESILNYYMFENWLKRMIRGV